MKVRSFLLRCVTILLILVFSQKSGTGLFIHSLLHTGKTAGELPLKQSDKDKHLGYACTCIDDFLMPYEEVVPVCSQPVKQPDITLLFFIEQVSPYTTYFVDLRGPPAV